MLITCNSHIPMIVIEKIITCGSFYSFLFRSTLLITADGIEFIYYNKSYETTFKLIVGLSH